MAAILDLRSTQKMKNFLRDHPMIIHVQFGFIQISEKKYLFVFPKGPINITVKFAFKWFYHWFREKLF